MFDSFEPFKEVQKQSFVFRASHYELWIEGKMANNGKTGHLINAKVITLDGQEKVELTFDDQSLHHELAQSNIFDEFVTAKDRLQLIIIPLQTNIENIGITGFRMILGATRQLKIFNRNEPYCCNLFLQEGKI